MVMVVVTVVKNCESFFEVNRYYIVVAALKALAEDGTIKVSEVSRAIKKFNIDSDKPNPVHL